MVRLANDRDYADCALDRKRAWVMVFRCALPQSALPAQRWKFCLYLPPRVQERMAILLSEFRHSQSCSLLLRGYVIGDMFCTLDFRL